MNTHTLEIEREPMEDRSGVGDEFAHSYIRDAAFEQLLRLAATFASQQSKAGQSGSRTNVRRSPVTEDIELRAYNIYINRGAAHGHDVDDWLQAERQVLEDLKKNKASLRLALAFGLLKDSAGR